MDQIIDKLFAACDNHGEDSGEPDHTVCDLQDMFRMAWKIMSFSQKLQFVRTPDLEDLLETGARDEFTAETLESEILVQVIEMESTILKADYRMIEGESGYFWETDEEASEDFHERTDAVVDAFNHLNARANVQCQESASAS